MRLALLALFAAFFLPSAHAAERGAQFQNLDSMIQALNLRPYFKDGVRSRRPVRIAIFDNGFAGAKDEIGKSLPRNTEIIPGKVAPPGTEDDHGFYMARILWSLLSNGGTDERYAPNEFLLYNTFGYTNLKDAVADVVNRQVDIVLYSQTWDYGGNFDGRGFINKLVDQALDAGILWVNSSGNTGGTTYNDGIRTGADDWLKLPGQNSSVELRCEKNPLNKCPLRAVLSWNDFTDNVDDGTGKDLDLVLTDDTLNIVAGSSLRQMKKPPDGAPGVSQYPREIIETDLKPGLYFFRIKNRSKNFTTRDRIRLSVQGDFLTLKDNDPNESVLPPADNPRVIAVGASDSDRSSLSRRLSKPELSTPSLVTLATGDSFKGTSNSAAMVAAGIAILRSINPALTRQDVLRRTGFASGGSAPGSEGRGLPLSALGFSPAGGDCFAPVNAQGAPAYIQQELRQGGTLVSTNAGDKILFPYDPIRLLPGIVRQLANDILVITATGPGIYARSGLWSMPPGMIELAQIPQGTQVCGASAGAGSPTNPAWTKTFRLP